MPPPLTHYPRLLPTNLKHKHTQHTPPSSWTTRHSKPTSNLGTTFASVNTTPSVGVPIFLCRNRNTRIRSCDLSKRISMLTANDRLPHLRRRPHQNIQTIQTCRSTRNASARRKKKSQPQMCYKLQRLILWSVPVLPKSVFLSPL